MNIRIEILIKFIWKQTLYSKKTINHIIIDLKRKYLNKWRIYNSIIDNLLEFIWCQKWYKKILASYDLNILILFINSNDVIKEKQIVI